MKTRLEKIAAKPIRKCMTMHHCELCNQDIRMYETYHDGGYNMRAHTKCVSKMMEDASDTSASDLANCPFCGAPARIATSGQGSVQVECTGCKVFPGWYDCARLAVEAWNRRAMSPEVKALVEALELERYIRGCRDEDEMSFAASGLRYSGAQLADAVQETDRALAAVKEGRP